MFLGEYEHTLDDKGRLAIPARFREALGEGVVITRGFDKCLMGFPRGVWEELARQVSGLPMGNEETRQLQRMLFAGAADMTLDKQGRILVPQNLREFAELGDQVIVAGLNRHFEIWAPRRWQNVLTSMDANASAFAQRLAELRF